MFVFLFVILLTATFWKGAKDSDEDPVSAAPSGLAVSLSLALGGFVLLAGASELFLHGALGIADHFWITGADAMEQFSKGVEMQVSYAFDGAATPSVSFEPAMMAGNGWAAVPLVRRSFKSRRLRAALIYNLFHKGRWCRGF